MSTTSAFPTGTVLGYPRIGRRRELKKAVEGFWSGTITADQLEVEAAALRSETRRRLHSLGLGRDDSSIPEAHSFYDQVLDTTLAVGAIPERFADLVVDGAVDLAGSFILARGDGERAPLEMTKWFDSNYHYLVPEIGPETAFSLADDRRVREVEEARAAGSGRVPCWSDRSPTSCSRSRATGRPRASSRCPAWPISSPSTGS